MEVERSGRIHHPERFAMKVVDDDDSWFESFCMNLMKCSLEIKNSQDKNRSTF